MHRSQASVKLCNCFTTHAASPKCTRNTRKTHHCCTNQHIWSILTQTSAVYWAAVLGNITFNNSLLITLQCNFFMESVALVTWHRFILTISWFEAHSPAELERCVCRTLHSEMCCSRWRVAICQQLNIVVLCCNYSNVWKLCRLVDYNGSDGCCCVTCCFTTNMGKEKIVFFYE